jgi:hypothetical protein
MEQFADYFGILVRRGVQLIRCLFAFRFSIICIGFFCVVIYLMVGCWGLHSSTFRLNLSTFCMKKGFAHFLKVLFR